jgi:hypothetical protein
MGILLDSVLTCPHCGFQKEERMPVESCQFFYACTSCGRIVGPKAGDCCAYCSYGTTRCPSQQQPGDSCCHRQDVGAG